MSPDRRVAVVVISHNRALELARLTELPEGPYVVVVDNSSSDGTARWGGKGSQTWSSSKPGATSVPPDGTWEW